MWRLVPALLLPVGAGLAVTHWVWPEPAAGRWRQVLKASLAVGGGLALSSCAFFVASLAWGPSRRVAIGADVLVLLGALALVWLGRPAPGAGRPAAPDDAGLASRGAPTALRLALGAALLAALVAFVVLSWVRPHGEWDAWAFWNLRARFLFFGGPDWRIAFDALAGQHPDYPLLLPGTIARIWLYVGRATLLAPVLVAMLFTFATVGVLGGAVAGLRGESQGLLAAVVLLGSVVLTILGTMQYADVPLAFFVLATLVLLGLYDRDEGARGRVAGLAGAMVGFAAWTKNEGLLFLVAILVARLGAALAGRDRRRAARELVAFGAGLAPGLAMVAYFKLRLAPPTLYMLGERLDVVGERLTDLTRYARIAEALLDQFLHFGDGVVSAAGVLVAYALLVGVRVPASDRRALAASALALAIVFAGYVVVFLLTVEALDNWLESGLTRLLVHLWPGAVFLYWVAVRPLAGARAPDP